MKYVLLLIGVGLVIAASYSHSINAVGGLGTFGGVALGSSVTIEVLRKWAKTAPRRKEKL
jgi:hypothetical protein